MKYFKAIFLIACMSVLFLGCSSTQLVEQWKNPSVDSLYVSKILIVGMTPNLEARKKFEQLLKEEYTAKGIEAVMSLELFDPSFTTDKKSYAELKVIENILTANFFDAVLFTKVVGSKTQKDYSKTYRDKKHLDMRFQEDYYEHQEIYYNSKYYDEYKIYRVETSLYCICPTKDRELVWKGSIDIIDPTSIEKTVNDYVNLLILTLEQQKLFN